MQAPRERGFTLIELLTVIAIIAILAALTFVGVSRVLERAKLSRMENDFLQIRNALAGYYTEHNSYPPAYGYVRRPDSGEPNFTLPDSRVHYLQPLEFYLAGQANKNDLQDEFADDGDTDRNDVLTRLEFAPVATTDAATDISQYPDTLYDGTNLGGQVAEQLEDNSGRPYIYIPVNLRHFKKLKQYWVENRAWYAERWDPSDPNFPFLTFPATSYDAYVLMSVGPGGSTFGLINPEPLPLDAQDAPFVYYIDALRAYFMATRDLNDNQELDFDFFARTQNNEGSILYEVQTGGQSLNIQASLPLPQEPYTNQLPDPDAPLGPGPVIFKVP